MKKLIFLLFLLISPAVLFAAEASFLWAPAPNPLWGTKIYIGTEAGNYTNSEDAGIGTIEHTVTNLQYDTAYYFTATHYNADGLESAYATEVTWTSPPAPVVTFAPLAEMSDGIKTYTITLTVIE